MSGRQHDDEARARARTVAQKLKGDPAFRQRVESDPFAALREAGVPEEALADFVREVGIESDVSGYMARVPVCDNDLTCIKSCLISTW